MKFRLSLISLLILTLAHQATSQLVNDGCNITVQDGALLHIQGDFTNQGGQVHNDGLIELRGNWLNTVASNPLGMGSGSISLLGTNQTIGGGFNTLFNTLTIDNNQTVLLENTIGISDQLRLNGGYIRLNANILHILNSNHLALPFSQGGGIITNSSQDIVRWDIGSMGNGLYQIPFANMNLSAIPISFDITRNGMGQDGHFLFSTYPTNANNQPLPQGINNFDLDGNASGLSAVDRFWSIQPQQYSQLPVSNISFTYEESTTSPPNDLDDNNLQVVRWGEALQEWEALNSSNQQNTVAAAELNAYGDFGLAEDSSPRIITCPEDIIVSCGNNGGTYVDWTVPTYMGHCDSCDDSSPIPGFFHMGTLNNRNYYCSLSRKTWPEAKAIANAQGVQLVQINSQQENDFLTSKLLTGPAWMGLNDRDQEGQFVWCNDSAPTYRNWYPGQPNNYRDNQDYVSLLSNGLWNDDYNSNSYEFIVERSCNSVTQTAGPEPGTFLSSGSYSVTYTAEDACSSFTSCTFNIEVEGGLTVTCPADINIQADNIHSAVCTWDTPIASSCCAECSTAQNISGFTYLGSFEGSHYYCSNSLASWAAAEQACQNNGGHLAIINSASENQYIASRLQANTAWIGASDTNNEGTFSWVDGSPITFSQWAWRQPNNYNGNQDYLELYRSGEWNDQNGTVSLEYVLEIPSCVTTRQISGPISGTVCPVGSHQVIYQFEDQCGNVETCDFNIVVAPSMTGPSYCKSLGNNSSSYIQSMRLASRFNNSGNDWGYGDYTHNSIEINNPQIHLIATPSNPTSHSQLFYWTFWIDYNQDGDFNDNFELIGYARNTGSINGVINLPSWANNLTTRMRCIMSTSNYVVDPCSTYSRGETEDYLLSIKTKHNNEQVVTNRERIKNPKQLEISHSIQENEIQIFPSPANETLTILNLDKTSTIKSITMINTAGQIVKSIHNVMVDNQLSVLDFPDGIYLIAITFDEEDKTYTERVIIQH